jgi:hypothetical protein
VLHSARYPRKPRGLPGGARSCCDFRYSFCCADCRHRTTPFSVRFFGRRVYIAAIMVVVSATRASAGTAAAMRHLDALGVPPLDDRPMAALVDDRVRQHDFLDARAGSVPVVGQMSWRRVRRMRCTAIRTIF